MDYFEHMKLRLAGLEEGVPGWLGAKDATRPFAKMMGVKTPTLFFEATADELPSKSFPSEFVLKPSFASTSIGVFLLRKVKPGNYVNLATGESIDVIALKEECQRISNEYYGDPYRGTFYCEMLLRDENGRTPPRDIRVYAFQGEIGFILAEDHISGKAKASYYNADFSLMSDVHQRFGVASGAENSEEIIQAPAPPHSEEILAVAERISIAVPSAFCRVDLYDTPDGIYLGELTFFPGTFYYRNRKLMFDQEANRLGHLWGDAQKRLKGSALLPAPNTHDSK